MGSSFPSGHVEPEGPLAKPARSPSVRPPYVARPTVQGIGRVDGSPIVEKSIEPESWAGKTVQAIDDLNGPPPGVLAPSRIISVGPADDEGSAVDLQSTKMVALAPLVDVAHAAPVDESEPSPSKALATTQASKRLPRHLLDPQLVLLLEPHSQRAASFRLLRDNLLAKNAPRIIAVSSGAEHEGKTTCAINLALALSERPSTRVLLLEGNFYAPSLAKVFHIDASTPFAPEMSLPWLSPYRVVEVAHGFHVAAVVHEAGEPPPPFNSRWYDMAMAHLADADYDYLIIDAPALDGSAAVLHVVTVAEGTLLTARSGSTTARTLRKAAAQIARDRVLGVTLMDADD